MAQTRWMGRVLLGFLGLLALGGMGCAHMVSETVRAEADPPLPFAELRANPEAYRGRTVILGGEILQTTNLREGTRLEVLQRPLTRSGEPKLTDETGGRFMAMCHEYLDPAIFAPGRRVTIGGQVLGTHTGQVGEVEYIYPLISCQEVHLAPRVVRPPPAYGAFTFGYGPPYAHFGYPWFWRPYRHPFWYW